MYKASLLLTCLLAFTSAVAAQPPPPPPRTPSPAMQQLRGAIRNMTPEQRARVRERIHDILNERRAREQPTAAPHQHSLNSPQVASPPAGWPALLQHEREARESLFPGFALRGRQDPQPLPDPGWGYPLDGVYRNLERLKLDLNFEEFDRRMHGVAQGIEELNRINRDNMVRNPPSVPRRSPLSRPAGHTPVPLPSASAASHVASTRMRVARSRVLVRTSPNGFPIGTLLRGDEFIATDRDRVNQNVAGRARGNVQKPGWTRLDKGLTGHPPAQSNPPAPVRRREAARDHLLDNYAFVINDLRSRPSPARITEPTPAYQNYDFKKGVPLDPLNRQLLPYDPVSNPRKFAWRYITDDGKFVMGRECRIDPITKQCECLRKNADGECVKHVPTYWVFVPVCAVAIEGYSLPCRR